MKWQIPAKTFLVGEYAALAGKAAIILTTKPCFSFALANPTSAGSIHPLSPAGLWIKQQNLEDKNFLWQDPYQGRGGLGASSAQFIGSYLACCFLNNQPVSKDELLKAYYQTWNGQGIRPSGYDIIAQTQKGCVYINQEQNQIESMQWSFPELSFLLIPTGKKLATHQHLLESTDLPQTDSLAAIVEDAKKALMTKNSEQLIHAVNSYQQQLESMNLVARHSLELLQDLHKIPNVLAAKGCGALGADILLLLVNSNKITLITQAIQSLGLSILSSNNDLYVGPSLFI